MRLFLEAQKRALLANGRWNAERKPDTTDFRPVVKLFCPWNGCTWLLSELDPDAPTIAFGLCDLGMGEPELGYVDVDELMSVRHPTGLTIERDRHFRATKTLTEYWRDATAAGRIKA